MSESVDEDEHVKEVYARFGLAVYFSQVLEHGLVNALVMVDLIPNKRAKARSVVEWGATVDAFMDRQFEATMGRLLKELRSVTTVPDSLEALLTDALQRRNRLAHDFFREHADNFMTHRGREVMLRDVDDCKDCFVAADRALDEVIRPMRERAGLTDEVWQKAYDEMKASLHDG